MDSTDLRVARKDAGLSVDDLAVLAGVPRTVVLDAEAGRSARGIQVELAARVRRHLVDRLMQADPDPSDVTVARQFVALDVEQRIEAWRGRVAFVASTRAA